MPTKGLLRRVAAGHRSREADKGALAVVALHADARPEWMCRPFAGRFLVVPEHEGKPAVEVSARFPGFDRNAGQVEGEIEADNEAAKIDRDAAKYALHEFAAGEE